MNLIVYIVLIIYLTSLAYNNNEKDDVLQDEICDRLSLV